MKRYRLTAHISLILKYCMLVYWENIFNPVMESGYGVASYRQNNGNYNYSINIQIRTV